MVKKIDLYIIKKFLSTYFFSILLLAFIIIVFDISEKIDDFTHERADEVSVWDIAVKYYLNFVPFLINQFNALFVFISVIFFTSKMASNSEIVATFSGGVSFYRLLLPYMVVAAVIFGGNVLMTFYVIPEANKVRIDFENRYLRNPKVFRAQNIHVQIEPDIFAYFYSFNADKNTAYKFSIERFEDKELNYKLTSNFANWDSAQHQWQIKDYVVREIENGTERLSSGKRLDTTLTITPRDFKYWLNNVETMNQKALGEYIEREKFKGSDRISSYEVERHKRLAFPFASLILTLMGYSIASRKIRGGLGMHLGLGILLCFSYILFSQMSFVYVEQTDLNPFMGVWFPNFLYTGITLYLMYKAPK